MVRRNLGAIIAAAIALDIASRDRRERTRERDEADLAQMRLVQVKIDGYSNSRTPEYNFRVWITNHGQRPILQVLIVSADLYTWEDMSGPAIPSVPSFTLTTPVPRRRCTESSLTWSSNCYSPLV